MFHCFLSEKKHTGIVICCTYIFLFGEKHLKVELQEEPFIFFATEEGPGKALEANLPGQSLTCLVCEDKMTLGRKRKGVAAGY